MVPKVGPARYDRPYRRGRRTTVREAVAVSEAITVVLAGATGRTGREVARAVAGADDMRLVAAVGRRHAGEHLGAVLGDARIDCPVVESLAAAWPIAEQYSGPRVLVDFTEPASAFPRLIEAVEHGWNIVVGTTGFTRDQRRQLVQAVQTAGVTAAVVANFSVGAWVAERLAEYAARYFTAVEVVEAHQERKRDKPSGTARQMAELLGQALERDPDSIPVHSIRLPGMVAHQAVIFGASGQILSIRHDVHDRSAYAGGALQAIRKVASWSTPGKVFEQLSEILDDGATGRGQHE